ncbi:hypothetical protein DL89DRAFT_263690 [Linderina pennispora]|uniref:Uncharacterized protein n=1 Tax=Linderina pennispora TaxID=61395 RepID=A0A1Y1WJB4_9FUNG|nr:uncharacterized protein DL89DRAFT_263690 [Linderina pennispora]ORX73660.1 hypothetical protein DL89DRAFT_263690 [Linderina pennispora]
MHEVRREIERETDRLAGSNKGIVKTPIHLRITAPDVLNLTLVDLPGITKIPVGDQPADIEVQTRELVMDYITKPNSVIVAISPANVDIVNSESLKMAREVDPDGKRTVGVVTKIDLMDRGTNSLDILTGRVYPLRTWDTQANKPIDESLAHEAEFFRTHPVYRTIQQHCGTSNLAKQLSQLLMHHIRDRLPSIKTKINALISQTEQELASYGRVGAGAGAGAGTDAGRLLKLITLFAAEFGSSIEGTGAEMSTAELCGGARLYYIFNDIFAAGLDSIAFQLLVKPQIKALEPPAQRCVQLAYEELMKVALSCGSNEMRRYPRLHAKAMEVVSDLLRERVGPTAAYVESLISIERAYINTNHPDFIGGPGALTELQRKLERKRKDAARERVREPDTEPSAVDPSEVDDRASSTQLRRPGSGSPLGGPAGHGKFFNSFFGAPGGKRDGLQISGDEVRVPNRLSNFSSEGTALDDEVSALSAQFASDLSVGGERDELETSLIRSLIGSYFGIVRKSIQDLVPKAVMHLLVNEVCENMQNRLVEELYKEPLTTELMQEDPALVAERDQCAAMLEVYKKAFAIINEAM